MYEHAFVEKPFLDQLASLDWQVIDQGPGVPTDPAKSLRTSFREVILKGVFKQSLNEINRTEKGLHWLTDKQLSDLIDEILNQPAKSLVEANEAVLKLLYRAQVDVNEVTGEQYPNVKLIDFDHPERNHFLAINQFRIDTPGAIKDFIIPDIVLFVNGLPLAVVEAKDANDFTANPMHEAFQQLMRYSDQREETKQAGLREGEPKLFFTNQLLIRTSGDRADFGAITATGEEFFYPWKDIYPEKILAVPPVLEARYRRLLQLFQDQGVAEIEPWVKQEITDPQRTYDILEQAIEGMKDLKQRANFEVYLKKFLQSMDIILPNAAAHPYKVPVKRFGYLLAKVKDRYKDDTLTISGAGEKVRTLINEHLISLGINPKIKPVELMSPRFIQELEQNKSPKAKASEMEHAIRKHCKVHLEEDPVLYQKLSDKLEVLIKKYKDDWDELYRHLFELRSESEAGRKDEKDPRSGPFFDLIGQIAFGKGGVPAEHASTVMGLVAQVLEKLKRTIGIINFWGNPPEVSKLKGELSDLLLFSNVDEIMGKSDKIVTEIAALAKVRHKDILS